ncbi:helix-turn-helix domain-containing protein [Sphingomonas hankyongi]|uniref:Helix-turn-helix transcriptional regulator n=1 Tax=Sphingomonas hankyongi TaxID=2908209 RepID=A0ABT0S293_9SPHN|nr:helix-turn-helix transcriptional regulator [Sphingomonas hankyongi]MCL6729963.1 helix-turn-helix transcriptional regulator [Sphingomonas hankyongi]
MIHYGEIDDTPHLSSREREILERVACGQSAKEVAVALGIGHRTVERHIENARYKMRARNKTHMITKAVMCGELVFNSEVEVKVEANDEGPPFIAGGDSI